ncbi:hypothetical protein A1O1_02318 [Capronia coronata CBS 617.96]|uniref:Uncharacterized protein n=1 Tax=Capronia coronata CBS 617.96 TaxID=1182541 RepID=W9YW90_9EURO|nr:uncharacterized protein A1O1_02318 [Capronia coronata CBS 617.96]EXJ93925.1 hypothetical protein A1O1_02318 [Capronia coronata CBS 617.96]
MVPSNPASPTLPSPRSPHSPTTSLNQHLAEPLPQLMTTCSLRRSDSVRDAARGETSASYTPGAANANGSSCRRNSLTTPVTSPTQMLFTMPLSPTYQMWTYETAHFQSMREDGRQSRMAMRSPRITLPLRVNTGLSMHSGNGTGTGVGSNSNTYTVPDSARTMASIREDEIQSPFSDTTTLLNWSPPASSDSSPPSPWTSRTTEGLSYTTSTMNTNPNPNPHPNPSSNPLSSSKRLTRPHIPSPISTSASASRSPRSPIRKKPRSHPHPQAQARSRLRLPLPPKYHVVVRKSGTDPYSPTTLRNRIQYMHSVEHLRAPLVPLISVSSGLSHPLFPTTLLQYHLLTHDQLDDLARWYHQVNPPVDETFMYPAWIPAWTTSDPENTMGRASNDRNSIDLETKRRRFGRFIGLRGCESPTAATTTTSSTSSSSGPEGQRERPDELARRMEREWRRALERAAEEEQLWEKGWRGRW